MKKINSIITSIALVIIAINMTISNLRDQPDASTKTAHVKAEQKVVQVVGRASSVFDGLGASIGFLAKDGEKLIIVRCDEGSMASNPSWKPQYLNVVTSANGQTTLDIITVDSFDKF